MSEEVVNKEEVIKTINSGKPLMLKDKLGGVYFYFDKFKMLIPIVNYFPEKKCGKNTEIFINISSALNEILVYKSLMK